MKNSNDEEECENSSDIDSDTDSVDIVEELEEDSETEQEDNAEDIGEEKEVTADGNNYHKEKDKVTKWFQNPFLTSSRTRPHNLFRHLPGPIKGAKLAKSAADCWDLLFIKRNFKHCGYLHQSVHELRKRQLRPKLGCKIYRFNRNKNFYWASLLSRSLQSKQAEFGKALLGYRRRWN